jgi:ABC-type oligopeptide transport system ATPase subunit
MSKVVEINNLKVYYKINAKKGIKVIRALENIDFSINKNEIF